MRLLVFILVRSLADGLLWSAERLYSVALRLVE